MPTANGRAKRKKNTCAAKPMRNAALRHRYFYRQKRTAGKSSSSTGIQRACRRGLRPHRPPASRGGGRCSKQPKAAKFGRQNPLCARWNSPEQLLDWREAWADAVNRALKEKQQPARVTHPQQKFTGRYRPLLPWMIFCSQKLNSARNKLQQTPVTMLFSLGNHQNLHAELLHRKIRCCGKHPIGQAVLKPAAV
ncbi:MAG: MobA/MobL family protein [Subdoligranulum variabile]|nr:MobA/MobL family protein [Subdoligranulum variabile]